ncbi:hypothetical protein BKA70DRAFT_1215982 [Coprinopsis sp. MPI-PUGE-AT-0042]|nr:hypothetical protein BKA70DRAFT_1215982 [Coprinopsis sp. MPI-PUGE-AT-0042]
MEKSCPSTLIPGEGQTHARLQSSNPLTMMPLSVSQDYSIPPPLTFSTWYKALFIVSVIDSTAILAISATQLCMASHYTSPIASTLTILYSCSLYFLCHQEMARDPAYAARRMRRMPTTRRITIAATFALAILWLLVCLLLILFITGVLRKKDDPEAYPGSTSWALGIVEVIAAGIQMSLMLAVGGRCLRERITILRHRRRPPSNQRHRFT